MPDAIAYHLAVGCSKIYVFWDGTTDDCPSLIRAFAGVASRDSVDPSEIKSPPDWIVEISPRWHVDLAVRQRMNTFYAARMAAAEGIGWLIGLDPDELIFVGEGGSMDGHVRRFLAAVPARYDEVRLRNLEAVATGRDVQNVFAETRYFLRRWPMTESIWRFGRRLVTRLFRSRKTSSWYDYWFYRMRFLGGLKRDVRDPRTSSLIPFGYTYGYLSSKPFIRTSTFESFKYLIHRWVRHSRSPRTIVGGNLLHYDLVDATQLATKFRQRDDGHMEASYARAKLADLARAMPDTELAEFFKDNLAIADRNEIERLRKAGIVREIDQVADFFRTNPPRAT